MRPLGRRSYCRPGPAWSGRGVVAHKLGAGPDAHGPGRRVGVDRHSCAASRNCTDSIPIAPYRRRGGSVQRDLLPTGRGIRA